MTKHIAIWRNKMEIEYLDRPVLQVDISVSYGVTKITVVLSGKELDYEIHQGDVMTIDTRRT